MMKHSETLLTRREVEAIVKLSRASIYNMMRREMFPVPIRVGPQAVRWKQSEIIDWLEARPRATGNQAA